MRKFLILLFSILLVFSLMINAFADEIEYFDGYATITPSSDNEEISFETSDEDKVPFRTISEMYDKWERLGYPEYVCGLWLGDGSEKNITIGILETPDTEKNKTELLSLIPNDVNITFVYQKYDKNYLNDIIFYILFDYYKTARNGVDLTVAGLYVDDIRNVAVVDIGEGFENDERVLAFVADLTSKYGEAVEINYGVEIPVILEGGMIDTGTIGAIDENPEKKENTISPILKVVLVPVIIAAISVILGKRKIDLRAQTSANTEVSLSDTPTKKEIEALIKNTQVVLPQSLDEKIKEKIKE